MDQHTLNRILKAIENGGTPTTLGYRITYDQYLQIEDAVKKVFSPKQAEAYLLGWKNGLPPEFHYCKECNRPIHPDYPHTVNQNHDKKRVEYVHSQCVKNYKENI